MDRITTKHWRNLDPWECCGQDYYCKRGCHDEGGCNNGCKVPKQYVRLAKYEDMGLSPEEISKLKESYLDLCENECYGDDSVGIPACPFFEQSDIDEKGRKTKAVCRLKEE